MAPVTRQARLVVGPRRARTSSCTWRALAPEARRGQAPARASRHRPCRPVRARAGGPPRAGAAPPRRASPTARLPARHRRADRDGQDRALAPGRRGADRRGHPSRDHLGRLAPGLPRPRHRDREGDRRPSGAASRITASTSSTRTRRSPWPTSPSTPGRRSAGSPSAAGSRSSSAERASTCGPSPAACRPTSCRADPEIRARLEAEFLAVGLEPLVERLRAVAPQRAAAIDTANPRRVVRALEIATVAGGEPELPAPRGYDGPVAWVGLAVEPATHREWIANRARAQFEAGLIDEARALRRALRPGAARVQRDRLPRGVGRPRRRADARGRDRRGRPPQPGVREAPADVVPERAGHRVADMTTAVDRGSSRSRGALDSTLRGA